MERGITIWRKYCTDCTRLARVASLGACSMRLEVLSVFGVQASILVGLSNEGLLSSRIGHCNTFLRAIMVDIRTTDDTSDLVTVKFSA